MAIKTSECKSQEVRQLNDLLRASVGLNGRIVFSHGVRDLSQEDQAAVFKKVREYSDFSRDTDPASEHSTGAFTHQQHNIVWEIRCFDPTLTKASDDPADPQKTIRLLRVMLAQESQFIRSLYPDVGLAAST